MSLSVRVDERGRLRGGSVAPAEMVKSGKRRGRGARLGAAGWALGAGLVAAVPAAQPPPDLDQRYPAGSIATQALAEQALLDAAAARQAIDEQFKTESARCSHVFLANECQDKARRAQKLGLTQVHRVELEAHDLQRKLAAQQRASERDVQQAQSLKQEAERPQKEREAQKAAQQRTDRAKEQAQDALRQQAQAPANKQQYEQRNAQHDEDEAKSASVKLRNAPENARRYKEKQAQAKQYAATRAREREENQKAREDRERERKRKAQTAGQAPEAAAPPSSAGAPANSGTAPPK